MSTHNIGLYEDLTKIIFQLSSKIKDTPYLVPLGAGLLRVLSP